MLLYLYTDPLNTPRAATEPNQTVLWRWEAEGFGGTAPVEDPDGDGTPVTVNLRFPGQYYDQETGLHYNWYRYYDAQKGRYITSDPIGLDGGVNTYGYVNQNPMKYVDYFGLVAWSGPVTVGDIGFILGGAVVYAELTSECVNGVKYKARVRATMGGLNIGFIPAGVTASNETLEDGLNYVDPHVLEGRPN